MNKFVKSILSSLHRRRVKSKPVSDNVRFVQELLGNVIDVLDRFPQNHNPSQHSPAESEDESESSFSMETLSTSAEARAKLQMIIDRWPPGLNSHFIQLTALIGQILGGYGILYESEVSYPLMMAAGMRDPEILKLLMRAGQLAKEAKSDGGKVSEPRKKVFAMDPDNMPQVLYEEVGRRVRLQRTPYGNTISTLLGHNALNWLAAKSQEGRAKIQAHEFSRTGWNSLSSITKQIAIEKELLNLGKDNEEVARIVVAACWTTAALASYMEPVIFVLEAEPHLSSDREGQLTVSYGSATRTIAVFDPLSMKSVVNVLRSALGEPELLACDLMWIAAGLARVSSVRSGHFDPVKIAPRSYSVFLSHRGKDAKRQLTADLMGLEGRQDIFLDCLALPRGLINRKFVFESLTNSDRIVLIETPHYDESSWCRKERWVAEAMQQAGLAAVDRISLDNAAKCIASYRGSVKNKQEHTAFQYPVTGRILKDIEYWGRQPNKYGLSEKKLRVEFLTPIEQFLEERAARSIASPIGGAAQHINDLVASLVAAFPEPDPIDSWSTALQYIVASLGLQSCAQSKMDVRRSIDQMNAALSAIISAKLTDHHDFRRNLESYISFIGAAVLLDMTGYALNPATAEEIRLLVKDLAVLKDGTLLLDVRGKGPRRDLNLKLLLALVTNNIGSVGLIQQSADMVHESIVDGVSLSILPCVTLHPGMESVFPELAHSVK